MTRSKVASPVGGRIAQQRTEAVTVPAGRLTFRLIVGTTRTSGPYTEFLLWPADSPADCGDAFGDLVWKDLHSHAEMLACRSDGEVSVIVTAGRYRYFGVWGVLKSPIQEIEVVTGEHVTVEIRFDLGPQEAAQRPVHGQWRTKSRSDESMQEVSGRIGAIARAIGDVRKALGL